MLVGIIFLCLESPIPSFYGQGPSFNFFSFGGPILLEKYSAAAHSKENYPNVLSSFLVFLDQFSKVGLNVKKACS